MGIIPAHAGLTAAEQFVHSGQWDHPRACGAHLAGALQTAGAAGSSPRMRGSQRRMQQDGHRDGIIPAHAGLTETGT